MIDKDCTERASITSVFPDTKILLCHFHVIKYLREKVLNVASGDKEEKKAALHHVHRMIYASSEEAYLEIFENFRSRPCISKVESGQKRSFLEYFTKNWHPEPVRALWASYARKKEVTLGNNTNNRAEGINRAIKNITSRRFSLPELIGSLMEFADAGVEDFKSRAYCSYLMDYSDSRSADEAFLNRFMTEPAAKRTRDELEFSHSCEVQTISGCSITETCYML